MFNSLLLSLSGKNLDLFFILFYEGVIYIFSLLNFSINLNFLSRSFFNSPILLFAMGKNFRPILHLTQGGKERKEKATSLKIYVCMNGCI